MNIIDRAKRALWEKSGLSHDSQGYVNSPEANLIHGIDANLIRSDFEKGSGQEWLSKFRAIHSSAALVANCFGVWKTEASTLKFLSYSGFRTPKFEAQCRTGLGGKPPNLDVLLQSDEIVIGIESKLLEPLDIHNNNFSQSYSRDRLPLCEDSWWSLLEQVSNWPPSNLHAGQLIKHYLGLRKQFSNKSKILLVYLYWKPLNAENIEEYKKHAADLSRFQNAIEKPSLVQFLSMDYLELWDLWEKDPGKAQHAKALKNRYCVEI